jgi:hypothetical protein
VIAKSISLRLCAASVVFVCFCGARAARGQSDASPVSVARLTNDDIIQLTKHHLPDSVILTAIAQAQQRRFDTSANGLLALNDAGVSDAVIAAMQKPAVSQGPSDGVVTAIIGGVSAIVVAFIGAWATRERKKRQEAEEKAVTAEKAIGSPDRYAAFNVTHSVELYEFDMTIHDDGSMDCIRRWSGIKTKQTLVDLKIPFSSAVSSPHGRAHRPVVESLEGSALPARFEVALESEQRIEGNIVVNGNLNPNTGYVGLRITHKTERAFLMTRSEVLAQYKDDAWKTEVNTVQLPIAVKLLKLEMHFPHSFKKLAPPPSPVVFLSGSETLVQTEIDRVSSTFTYLESRASWTISDPKMGLQYGVAWLPPDVRTS